MKKFFKIGSSKKKDFIKSRRSSLGSIGSAASFNTAFSSSTGSGWGSVHGLNIQLENNKCYQVNTGSDKSLTKLHKACWSGNVEKVEKHINKELVNQTDSENRTPLHLAASRGYKDITLVLLRWNAKLNLRDASGFTPLLKAIQCGYVDIAEFLLEKGANPTVSDKNGNTGLHLVACSGQQDIALALIQAGADIDIKNKDGMTPLVVSTIHRQIEITNLLIRHGAAANVVDENHKTCLMYACEEGYLEHVKLFLLHKIDISVKNFMGFTAEDIARTSGHDDCANLIKDQRAKHSLSDGQNVSKRDSVELQPLGFPSQLSDLDLGSEDAGPGQIVPDEIENDSWNDDSSIDTNPVPKGLSSDVNVVRLKIFRENDHLLSTNCNNTLQQVNELLCNSDNLQEKEDNLGSCNLNPDPVERPAVVCAPDDLDTSDSDASVSLSFEHEYQKAEVPKSQDFGSDTQDKVELKNHRDLMAELGLSDISECTTPSLKFYDDGEKCNENVLQHTATVSELPRAIQDDAEETIDRHLVACSTEPSFKLSNLDRKSDFVVCQNVDIVDSHAISHSKEEASLDKQLTNCITSPPVNAGIASAHIRDNSDWDSDSNSDDIEIKLGLNPSNITENGIGASSASPKMITDDSQAASSTLVPCDEKHAMDVNEFSNSSLSPLKGSGSRQLLQDGTLGRIGTMHEVDEIWESNPCLESSTPAIKPSTEFSKNSSSSSHSSEKLKVDLEFGNSQDNNSQGNSDTESSILKAEGNMEDIVMDRTKLWEQALATIFGSQNVEIDTESVSEISTLNPANIQPNKDSFQEASTSDEQSNTISIKVDEKNQLMFDVLQDSSNIHRVIRLIQDLKLLWIKEQDKCKILNVKVNNMKSENDKAEEKLDKLNHDKTALHNQLLEMEREIDNLKRSLTVKDIEYSEAELELRHKDTQLKSLEETLTKYMLEKQEAELAMQFSQNELRSSQNLVKQIQEYGSTRNYLMIYEDASCQTEDANYQLKNDVINCTNSSCQTEDVAYQLKNDILKCTDSSCQTEVVQREHKEDVLETDNGVKNSGDDYLQTLQSELAELNCRLQHRDAEFEQHLEKFIAITREKDNLVKRIEELVQENLSLSSEVSIKKQKNGHLSTTLTDVRCQLEESSIKVCLLSKELETKDSCESKIKLDLKTREIENEKLKMELAEQTKQFDDLQSTYSKLKIELQSTTKINSALEEMELGINNKWDTVCSCLRDDYEKTIKHLNDYNAILVNSKQSLQTTIKELHSTVENLNQELTQALNQKSQLSSMLKSAQTNLENKTQEIQLLEEKYISMKDEADKANHLIIKSKEKEISHTKEIEAMTFKLQKLSSAEEEISELKSTITLANNRGVSAEKHVKELEKKLEEQVVNSTLQNDILKQKLESASEKLRTAEDIIKRMSDKEAGVERITLHRNKFHNEHSYVVQPVEESDIKLSHSENDKVDSGMLDFLPGQSFHKLNEPCRHIPFQPDDFGSDYDVPNHPQIYNSSTSTVQKRIIDKNTALNFPEKICDAPPETKSESSIKLAGLELSVQALREELKELKTVHIGTTSRSTLSESKVYDKDLFLTNLQHQMELLRNELHAEQMQRCQCEHLTKRFLQASESLNRAQCKSNYNPPWTNEEEMHHREPISYLRLNQQLTPLNKLFNSQPHEEHVLIQLLKDRDCHIHQGYLHSFHNLQLEVQKLNEHLKDKDLYQATLNEHNRLIHELRDTRKRVKAKLAKTKNSRYLETYPINDVTRKDLLERSNRNAERLNNTGY